MAIKKVWKKVLDNPKKLLNDRVMTVSVDHKSFCLTNNEKKFQSSAEDASIVEHYCQMQLLRVKNDLWFTQLGLWI